MFSLSSRTLQAISIYSNEQKVEFQFEQCNKTKLLQSKKFIESENLKTGEATSRKWMQATDGMGL